MGVLHISSDRDDERIFLRLKLLTLGFFQWENFGNYFFNFWVAWFKCFFGGHSKQSKDSILAIFYGLVIWYEIFWVLFEALGIFWVLIFTPIRSALLLKSRYRGRFDKHQHECLVSVARTDQEDLASFLHLLGNLIITYPFTQPGDESRGTVRGKLLAQDHNTITPVRVWL